MPRFRLINVDGDDLGPFQAAAPNWAAADRIHRGGYHRDLVVVQLVPAEDGDDADGYLVVEPVTPPRPERA